MLFAGVFAAADGDAQSTGRYGRMFPEAMAAPANAARLKKLEALGRALLDDGQNTEGHCSLTPPRAGYTYFGQFVDHDLTFDRTRLEEAQNVDADKITNNRTPWLDLDQVYDGGPAVSPQLYKGPPDAEQFRLVGTTDLPLLDGYKCMGDQSKPLEERDLRDLENAILLQMHVLFMRLHNKAVENGIGCGIPSIESKDRTSFNKAARFVRWQYQYLVRKDYLRNVIDIPVLSGVQSSGPHFKWPTGGFFIPIEFSAASFRFGHSMVRESYVLNKNPPSDLQVIVSAKLATQPLPSDLVVEWSHFFGGTAASAKAIDTQIVKPLGTLDRYITGIFTNAATALSEAKTHSPDPVPLPVRTLQRGARMRLPTGQAIVAELAKTLPVIPLTDAQLTGSWLDNVNHKPDKSGLELDEDLLRETPLFYYILREAEARHCGSRLGPVGSQIVADVIEGSFRNDPDSFWNMAPDWQPTEWKIPGDDHFRILTMADLVKLLAE